MKKNRKSGFTIVEVVVSMALIAIVLATTFLLCSYTLSTQNKLKLNNFFANESEKISYCYFNDETNYTQNIELATGVAGVNFGDDFEVHFDNLLKLTDVENEYCYDLLVSFESGKMIFEAKTHFEGKTVFQKEVTL